MPEILVQLRLQCRHFLGELLALRLFEEEVNFRQLRLVEGCFRHLKLMLRVLPHFFVEHEKAHPALPDGIVVLCLFARMRHARIFVLTNDGLQPYLKKLLQIVAGKFVHEVREPEPLDFQFRYGRRKKYRIYILYLVTHSCLPLLFLTAAHISGAHLFETIIYGKNVYGKKIEKYLFC